LDQFQDSKILSFDKLGHLLMYAVMGAFMMYALYPDLKFVGWLGFICIVFSAITELVQHYFISFRHGEWTDFLSNLIGLFLGAFLFKLKIKT